jgi:hypothetical protein
MSGAAEVWTAIGAAFGASILTTIGTRWIAEFQAKRAADQEEARRAHELQRDRREDERRTRDAKRERLREDYVQLISAGLKMDEVAAELLFVDDEDLSTERWARLDRALSKAKEDLDRAVVRVMLESEAAAALESYTEIKATFRLYGIALVHETRSPQDPQQSMGHLTRMRSLLDQLKSRAREHLDSLAKPI